MIRLFRDNNPFLPGIIFLYALGLRLSLFLFPHVSGPPAADEPFTHLFFHLFRLLPGAYPLKQSIAAAVIVFGEALYLNYITGKYKLLPQTNFLPALCYILLSSLFSDWQILSAPLLCNFVLLILLEKIFWLYKREKAEGIIFNIGFTLAIAMLFSKSSLVFTVFIFIGILFVRPFHWREWLLLLCGIFVVLFLAGVYFFWVDELPAYLHFLRVHFFVPGLSPDMKTREYLLKTCLVAGLLAVSLLKVYQQFAKAVVQTRNFYSVLVWFIISGFPVVFLVPLLSISDLFWTVIPLSVIAGYWFSEARKVWIAEVFHLCLILAILFYQYSI